MRFSWHTRCRLWLLWRRHSWFFQWAHKPLCGRFSREVFRIGKLRVCRSCTLLYAGAIAGALFFIFGRNPFEGALPAVLLGSTAAVVFLSAPPLYSRFARGFRDVLRFAAGLCVSGTLLEAVYAPSYAAMAGIAVLGGAYFVFARGRARRQHAQCGGCPELAQGGVCSGFAEQAEAARKYEERASEAVACCWRPEARG